MGRYQFKDEPGTPRQEWNAAYRELRALKQRACEVLGNDPARLSNLVEQHCARLDAYRRNAQAIRMAYHVLTGAAPRYADAPIPDFPGDYSVKAFYSKIITGAVPGF